MYVNFFNGSEKSKVEFRIADGPWQSLTHTREIDPKFQRVFEREAALLAQAEAQKAPAPFRALPKPKASSHLWKGMLPGDVSEGTHAIEVRAVDDFGHESTSSRVIRVRAAN